MRPSLLLSGIVGGVLTASTALAQAPSARGVASGTAFEVTPYAGYMISGDFIKGPLGTSVYNAPGALYGAQLGMKLSPNVALVGNLGYSTSDVRIGIPFIGGYSVATSSMLLYDGGLQVELPITTASGFTLKPFLQGGAGAIRYGVQQSLVKLTATNFAANFGGGADITLGQSLGLRLMAKDYVGKFDFKEATSRDLQSGTAHNWGLSAGLRVNF